MSKQLIPAVEAFWTQNKIIIESPLACTTGSAFRNKFSSSSHMGKHGKTNSVNSPLTNELNFNKKKSTASASCSTASSGLSVGTELKNNVVPKLKRDHKDQSKYWVPLFLSNYVAYLNFNIKYVKQCSAFHLHLT